MASGSSPNAQKRRLKEQLQIQERRVIVSELRFKENLTASEIVVALKSRTPPIKTSKASVIRDIELARRNISKSYTREGFNALEVFAVTIRQYEIREEKLMKAANTEKDNARMALLIRTANDCSEKRMSLLQDVGFIDRRLGTLLLQSPDDGKKTEPLPSGEQLQKYFSRAQQVIEGSLVSDGEKEWYGQSAENHQRRIQPGSPEDVSEQTPE